MVESYRGSVAAAAKSEGLLNENPSSHRPPSGAQSSIAEGLRLEHACAPCDLLPHFMQTWKPFAQRPASVASLQP
eukprot:3916983-Amphidinium_carterae.1